MHAPAALQFNVHRFGVWRALLGAIALLLTTVVAAWLATRSLPVWAAAWTLSLLVASWVGLAGLARIRPLQLHWDTQHWHVGSSGSPLHGPFHAPQRCELQLAVDLGPWMLLRLLPLDAGFAPWQARWVPVQQRGHEAVWHALRCTVHSGRSDAGGFVAAALGGAPQP
ncbi:MAG: hypothetical protein RLZZ618_3365 [Pseudomonadota bacterium]|jgi:hypothetical protein